MYIGAASFLIHPCDDNNIFSHNYNDNLPNMNHEFQIIFALLIIIFDLCKWEITNILKIFQLFNNFIETRYTLLTFHSRYSFEFLDYDYYRI